MEDSFKDFHEKTKYKLVKHLCWFFIILMSLVTVVNLSNEKSSALLSLSSAVMCLLSLVFLRYTRNYKLVAILCALIAFLIISSSFISMDVAHYLTPMWMIVNIMFTFFILGKYWGIGILAAHFLVLFYYLIFLHEDVVSVTSFTGDHVASFVIEYAIVGFSIGYLLNLYILTNKYSEKELQENNDVLVGQNRIISKQNSEMEVMLREIHHRVKNNLQIITSLLRLQANSAHMENDSFYRDAVDRVTAMAIIHEKMYQSGSLSRFDLEKYLITLIDSLLMNYSIHKRPVFSITVDLMDMKSKSIVPLALLINELLLNSLKHAFKSQDNPEIEIRLIELEEAANNRFVLDYSDNGTWAENATASFGTEIIQAMSEQLEGGYELKTSDKGTRYVFNLANLS